MKKAPAPPQDRGQAKPTTTAIQPLHPQIYYRAMYSDAFDHYPDHRPTIDSGLPSPWRRRALGFGLLALLVLMHSCG